MAKILRDTNSRQEHARDDHLVNGDHLQGMMEWIENDTERDYSQREDGKTALVFGDRGDGENPEATLIQESERLSTTNLGKEDCVVFSNITKYCHRKS